MFTLKPITSAGVPAALDKAERYRLLNEPIAAESICLDILEVEPGHQDALITLLLARTDQFPTAGGAVVEAREVLPRLRDPYQRAYYAGLIEERRALALLHSHAPGSALMASQALRAAMEWYQMAEPLRPAGNDDALLRWNACVRLLQANPHLVPAEEEREEPILGE
jgi:hypothetical protein